jgi:hypothetical protein
MQKSNLWVFKIPKDKDYAVTETMCFAIHYAVIVHADLLTEGCRYQSAIPQWKVVEKRIYSTPARSVDVTTVRDENLFYACRRDFQQ